MTDASSSKHLLTETKDRVLTVRLRNPPLNFLTSAMMTELDALLRRLEGDRSVGAVILTGGLPDVFLTHFDVAEIKAAAEGVSIALPPRVTDVAMRAEAVLDHVPGARNLVERTPLAGLAQMNLFHEVTARMRALDKVFIAAINGRAMGGGCELALACDLRVMADGGIETGQILAQPEILIGLIPGGGGTQMLARTVGVARALELCLEGKLLSPREAHELGLVHRVVPGERLMDEAFEWAKRLARRPASAVRAIKHAIYQGASLPFDEGMTLEKAEFLSAATQSATRRAMVAYAEHVGRIAASSGTIRAEDFREWLDGTAVDFNG